MYYILAAILVLNLIVLLIDTLNRRVRGDVCCGYYSKKNVETILRNIAQNNVPLAEVGRTADKIDEFNAGEVDKELREHIYAMLKDLADRDRAQVEEETQLYMDMIESMEG